MDLHDLLPNVRHLAVLPHIRDLAIAYALAFLIGWNREREDRSAGMRTFPLVAIAACGFIQATEGLLRSEPAGMARIIEGVITGIGFIGRGANLKDGGEVHGTAPAAPYLGRRGDRRRRRARELRRRGGDLRLHRAHLLHPQPLQTERRRVGPARPGSLLVKGLAGDARSG